MVVKEKSEIQVQDYVAAFYEKARYQKPYSQCYHDWWNRKMLSMVSTAGRILDNGCGTGIILAELSRHQGQVTGLDISHQMLTYARNRGDRLVSGDSQQLPFKDGSFDLVVGRSLLHHLPEPLKGVAEMARVLRPGGEIVIVDTNRSVFSHIPRLLAQRGEHFSEDHQNMPRRQLVTLLENYFRVDSIYHFGYLAYPIGFPDILDIGKYLPYPTVLTKALIKMDEWIAMIPALRTQSWGIMIKGTKPGNCHV